MYVLARWSKPAQWIVALLGAVLCLGIVGGCFALIIHDWRWFPLLFVATFVLPPLESLLLTPLYTLAGRFIYYSPMLLATRRRDGGLDLHVGTLFDYALRFRWADRGPRAARIATIDLLRGLLGVIEGVERGDLRQDASIAGASYFFQARTVRRFGFDLQPAPPAIIHNLVIASISIALRLSFTRGRCTLPDLRRTHQAITTGARLVAHKADVQRALDQLTRHQSAQR